jgi:UV DNA damage endonuclease
MRLGYCCINLSLKDRGVTINRGMTQKTWKQRGLPWAAELAEKNLTDLLTILEWNREHDIPIYRMSSDIFPWMSEYELEQLPNFSRLAPLMAQVGAFVESHGMRLSFHPGQFDVLASPNPEVVRKTVWDLDQHARIMDLMGLPKSYDSAINIHVGGTYGDKESALDRFCLNFERLSDSTKARLVVENDDKASQFSVKDLYHGVHSRVGCPITFDHLHHRLCTGGLDAYSAATLAASTWQGHTPLQHFSSPKSLHEDSKVVDRSHADYVHDFIPHHGLAPDVEIEAKAKDLAVLQYRVDRQLLERVEPKLFPFETPVLS